jgi:predicted 3-demethylubiquinone-9 3-methyltransferase (glyoxalase superfamily)
MQKIITCIGFNDQAEAAVTFYTSIVRNSKILTTTRYGDAGPGPKGAVVAMSFLLNGEEFMALNGGPSFTFTHGLSIVIKCETQAEIDELWERLSEGGKKIECGWLTDKFGLSWQIVPTVLLPMLNDPDPEKSQRVMKAMLQMQKLEIGKLKEAYAHA